MLQYNNKNKPKKKQIQSNKTKITPKEQTKIKLKIKNTITNNKYLHNSTRLFILYRYTFLDELDTYYLEKCMENQPSTFISKVLNYIFILIDEKCKGSSIN